VTLHAMNARDRIWTLDYLAQVAKDWVVGRFASAERSDYVLLPHRFELDGQSVRRHRLARRSREALNPLAAATRPRRPVVWARAELVTRLIDTPSGTMALEQEIVEILGADGEVVVAEAAIVVRTPDLPPCLGPFSAAL
jgi:hypothetical protein